MVNQITITYCMFMYAFIVEILFVEKNSKDEDIQLEFFSARNAVWKGHSMSKYVKWMHSNLPRQGLIDHIASGSFL
jgi:hypothetical protein